MDSTSPIDRSHFVSDTRVSSVSRLLPVRTYVNIQDGYAIIRLIYQPKDAAVAVARSLVVGISRFRPKFLANCGEEAGWSNSDFNSIPVRL